MAQRQRKRQDEHENGPNEPSSSTRTMPSTHVAVLENHVAPIRRILGPTPGTLPGLEKSGYRPARTGGRAHRDGHLGPRAPSPAVTAESGGPRASGSSLAPAPETTETRRDRSSLALSAHR